ncbi:hypothetical protein [Sphingomonas bacterium]|uniref:hypothetical protein n=1 Tax=Sphingomonas bacterium TaxID=1895847 RepID=UPI0026340992|nr:hypothetical protein [Sphingomonas bacterium]
MSSVSGTVAVRRLSPTNRLTPSAAAPVAIAEATTQPTGVAAAEPKPSQPMIPPVAVCPKTVAATVEEPATAAPVLAALSPVRLGSMKRDKPVATP